MWNSPSSLQLPDTVIQLSQREEIDVVSNYMTADANYSVLSVVFELSNDDITSILVDLGLSASLIAKYARIHTKCLTRDLADL